MTDNQKFAAMGCGAIAIIFGIVALATNGWYSIGSTDWGLFEAETGGVTFDIDDLPNVPDDVLDKIRATRAFVIIQLLLTVVAVVLCQIKAAFAPFAFGAAAVCGLIATAIFADLYNDNLDGNGDLEYGFALNIVAWLLCLVAAAISFMAGK